MSSRITLMVIMALAVSLFCVELARGEGRSTVSEQAYLCPPCGCPLDEVDFPVPGRCPHCEMPLKLVKRGSDRERWMGFSALFEHAELYSPYYVRLVYPLVLVLVLLVIFLGVSRGVKGRLIWFLIFALSLGLYLLKFQLYGTTYAFNFSRRALYFPIGFLAIIWPALYLFARPHSLARPEFTAVMLHLMPAGAIGIIQMFFFLDYPASESYFYNHFDASINPIEQGFLILGMITYGPVLARHGRSIPNWLLTTIVLTAVVTLVMAGHLVINGLVYAFGISTLDYHLVWLAFTILILWCCWMILFRKTQILRWDNPNRPRIPADKLEGHKQRAVEVMMNSQPFTDAGFSLQEFGQLLGLSEKETSELIKMGFNSNFYDFVSKYRVALVKGMLVSTGMRHLTNMAIAEKAGFRSKTTFINAFKKHTGMTPREYQLQNDPGRKGP